MDLYEKISILGPSAKYDTCGPRDFGNTTNIPGVYHAKIGGGHICRLFKVLQTNVCKNNCNYCAFRRDRDSKRIVATPEEMAQAFDSAYKRKLVDGLFLSSGISRNADITMSRMLDTAYILRKKYEYKGYVHLKIMPGSSRSSIVESLKLANRVSLNIEAPTQEALTQLSPDKNLQTDLIDTMNLVKNEVRKLKFAGKKAPSVTTQFVVGANEERDREFVKSTFLLYKKFNLRRVFYSAFRPIKKTPLSERLPETTTRVHRLYQTDFLMRFYKFSPSEIPFDEFGSLDQTSNPKLLWAQRHPEFYPIDLNTADYWNLLRIPGIGPVSAKKIIKMRNQGKIRWLEDLAGNRLLLNRMSSFVCF